jgi:hypothetical protein
MPKCPTVSFGRCLIHITAIMQVVHILQQWVAHSMFVILGFEHVSVKIDQAFAW